MKRRQEILHDGAQVKVLEDFGHHPTALAETLQALRQRYPGHLLTAVFEPRSNTARTKVLQAGFMRALAQADEVYLGAVNRAEKLAADERFDTAAVVQQLETQGIEAHTADTNAALLDGLVPTIPTLVMQTPPQHTLALTTFESDQGASGPTPPPPAEADGPTWQAGPDDILGCARTGAKDQGGPADRGACVIRPEVLLHRRVPCPASCEARQ